MKKLLFSLGTAALVMALATNAAAQTTPAPSPQATMAPSPSVPMITPTPMHSTTTSPPVKRGLLNKLKNILNSNTVTVTLSDILNANKIALGQVVGLFINGGGIITTIIS